MRGLGAFVAWIFTAIGWFIDHILSFIVGMLGDAIRLVGAVIAMVLFVPIVLVCVVFARWSAAGHFGGSVKRELTVFGLCLYRIALQRPLNLLMLGGLLEGIEQRVPEAVAAAPPRDPNRRAVNQFPGYTIVATLPGGGSGARLFVAEPSPEKRRRLAGEPAQVVIKAFNLSSGSNLPQIVRESSALQCARTLGLVLEHSLDADRFYYVMTYHAGEHLGVVTRQLHGESPSDGLGRRQLVTSLGYLRDLLVTLEAYHHGGLWHKDVKPENIIVHDGQAHLVDLGLVTRLQSAMTLTTHGTEYFRDPELVRQALRGAKVHEIDGTKFDVYAAGAVLYFIVENTFPGHGGLSAFSKRSPESVKWIIRRAMADYNQRYETVDAMLADIDAVLVGGDPAQVRPADLPSMTGATPAQRVASAGSPMPPPIPAAAPARPAAGPQQVAGAPAGASSGAPALNVTNWWTGSYSADAKSDYLKAGAAKKTTIKKSKIFGLPVVTVGIGEGAGDLADELGRAAVDLGRELSGMGEKARRPAGVATPAGTPAADQLRSARARVQAAQKRASASGRHGATPRQGARYGGMVAGIVGLAIVCFLGLVGFALIAETRSHSYDEIAVAAPHSSLYSFPRYASIVEENLDAPLMLINDHPAKSEPDVAHAIDQFVEELGAGGWLIEPTTLDVDLEVELRSTIPPSAIFEFGDLPEQFKDALDAQSLGGVLLFRSAATPDNPHRMMLMAITPAGMYTLEHDPGTDFEVKVKKNR
jgi:serine/threonine protein kinase